MKGRRRTRVEWKKGGKKGLREGGGRGKEKLEWITTDLAKQIKPGNGASVGGGGYVAKQGLL